jgi:hypothetical protein
MPFTDAQKLYAGPAWSRKFSTSEKLPDQVQLLSERFGLAD